MEYVMCKLCRRKVKIGSIFCKKHITLDIYDLIKEKEREEVDLNGRQKYNN